VGIRTFATGILAKALLRAYPPNWLARLFGEYNENETGINVTEANALTLPVFFAGVDLISRSMATMPCLVYKRTGDDSRSRATGFWLYDVLKYQPNVEQNAFHWFHSMTTFLLTWGNAYAEIQRNGAGEAVNLWPIHPKHVTVERVDGEIVYKVSSDDGTRQQIIRQADMFHVHGLGDGLVGYSMIRQFRESIGLGLAAQKTGASFFGKAMRPSGVYEHPGALTDEAYKRLKADLDKVHSGAENTGRAMLLESGMKWHQLTIPPDDAQFLETRVFQVQEIARVLHIPPHKLAEMSNSGVRGNIEEQNIDYFQDCLAPHCVCFEQEINAKLLREGERKRFYAEFLFQSILRTNSEARSNYYSRMFNIGALSPNDIRRLENENPIGPEGDVYFVQGASVPLKIAMQGPQPAPAPEPMPEEPEPEEPTKPADTQKNGLRAVLLDACKRVCNLEIRVFEAALKKVHHASEAARAFEMDKHQKDLREKMRPSITDLAEQYGIQDIQALTREIVDRHTGETVHHFGFTGYPNDELLEQWGHGEPKRWAEDIIRYAEEY